MNDEELINFLFDDNPDPAAVTTLKEWFAKNPRFREFMDAYRSKIRKRIRLHLTNSEVFRDDLNELYVAQHCLRHDRMEVVYEKHGSKLPGPDFTVTFECSEVFNIEVVRIHETELQAAVHDVVTGFGKLMEAKVREIRSPLTVMLEGDGFAVANYAGADAAN